MKNMYKNLLPWRLYNNIFEIDFDELNRLGVKNYFFDFDNTLMKWGSNTISERVKEFLHKLKQEGFSIYIVTNGKGSRFKVLQSYLPQDVTVLQNMKKPNPEKFKNFLQRHNINPHHSVFIGDNLMTDIRLGNKIGCITIKVKPISFREFFGTKFYRFLELFVYLFNSQYFTKLKRKEYE